MAIGEGDLRRVHLVVPDGYSADRPWPLIYALHPSCVKGEDWARQVRVMLGSRAREFVIAAPDDYKQNYIAARPPFSPEHPAILDAVARAVHVDANRVYALGYSKGGFGTWFVALYYADRFAGAVALAAAFDVTVDEGGFWKQVASAVQSPLATACSSHCIEDCGWLSQYRMHWSRETFAPQESRAKSQMRSHGVPGRRRHSFSPAQLSSSTARE